MTPKRKVTDLLPSEAILISSDAERDAVLKLMDEAGMKWNSGNDPLDYIPTNPYSYFLTYKAFGGDGICVFLPEFEAIESTIYPATDFIPTESDEVEVDRFDRALKLLKDLADLQNGAPIEQHRTEWEQTMDEVYTFLNQHETRNTQNQ